MQISALRTELGLSLDGFAKSIGLSSKGYVSQLERGEVTPSVQVALRLEELSGGRILARDLNPDVARVEAAVAARAGEDGRS